LPAPRDRLQLAVSLVGEAPFEVPGVQVSGEEMTARGRVVRQNGIAWSVETVFESRRALGEGEHVVDVAVTGLGRLVSLDVYEGRSLPAGALGTRRIVQAP